MIIRSRVKSLSYLELFISIICLLLSRKQRRSMDGSLHP